MTNTSLIQPTIRRVKRDLSPEDILENYALKDIDALEAIKWVNGFDQIQIHKLKTMAKLFELLNQLKLEPVIINEIYDIVSLQVKNSWT